MGALEPTKPQLSAGTHAHSHTEQEGPGEAIPQLFSPSALQPSVSCWTNTTGNQKVSGPWMHPSGSAWEGPGLQTENVQLTDSELTLGAWASCRRAANSVWNFLRDEVGQGPKEGGERSPPFYPNEKGQETTSHASFTGLWA